MKHSSREDEFEYARVNREYLKSKRKSQIFSDEEMEEVQKKRKTVSSKYQGGCCLGFVVLLACFFIIMYFFFANIRDFVENEYEEKAQKVEELGREEVKKSIIQGEQLYNETKENVENLQEKAEDAKETYDSAKETYETGKEYYDNGKDVLDEFK